MSIVEETLRSQREAWKEISERTLQSLQEFPFEKPKRILLFGLGSSHFAARLSAFAYLRDRTRTRVPVIACNSTSVGNEVIPMKGDWAFGFSHRGTSKPTLEALEACERAGAVTTIVCGQGVKDVPHARHILDTVPIEKVEPHTASVTGAICAVTTLLLGEKAVEEWDAVRSVGDPDLELLRRRAGDGPTVILGEWEGEWIAREGALKFMEMAKLPVRAFGSEEFFHGPWFSVTPADRIWHVSMPKDPRNPDVKAAYSVNVFGGTPLAWVPALVELQWLALAVALNRGADPDHPEKGE